MHLSSAHAAALQPRWTPGAIALTVYAVLFAAAQLALESDVLILPPVLIFAALDHAIAIALICFGVAMADMIRLRTFFAGLMLVTWGVLIWHPLLRN